jgi:hypothetical protein
MTRARLAVAGAILLAAMLGQAAAQSSAPPKDLSPFVQEAAKWQGMIDSGDFTGVFLQQYLVSFKTLVDNNIALQARAGTCEDLAALEPTLTTGVYLLYPAGATAGVRTACNRDAPPVPLDVGAFLSALPSATRIKIRQMSDGTGADFRHLYDFKREGLTFGGTASCGSANRTVSSDFADLKAQADAVVGVLERMVPLSAVTAAHFAPLPTVTISTPDRLDFETASGWTSIVSRSQGRSATWHIILPTGGMGVISSDIPADAMGSLVGLMGGSSCAEWVAARPVPLRMPPLPVPR